jgi:hypothetical protein
MTSLVAVAETPFIPQSMADDMSLAMLSAVSIEIPFLLILLTLDTHQPGRLSLRPKGNEARAGSTKTVALRITADRFDLQQSRTRKGRTCVYGAVLDLRYSLSLQ